MPDTVLQFYRERCIGPGGTSTKTDRDGRFRVDGLVAGQKYDALLLESVSVFQNVMIEPGETKNLGQAQMDAKGGFKITP